MFEKFSNLDVDSAGQGGEYTVQVRLYIFHLFFITKLNIFFLGRLVSDGLMEPYFGLQVIMVKCWRHLNVQISCRIQNR